MLPVRHRVICDSKMHAVTLQPNGELTFHNHSPKEMERWLSVSDMGGKMCLCGQIMAAWRAAGLEKNSTSLNAAFKRVPPAFVPYRENQVRNKDAWRLLRRLNTRRGASAYAYIEQHWRTADDSNLTPEQFAGRFVQLVVNQLQARTGKLAKVEMGKDRARITEFAGVKMEFTVEFGSNKLMHRQTFPAGVYPQSATIVRNKNIKRQLYLSVDLIEQASLAPRLIESANRAAKERAHAIDEATSKLRNQFFSVYRRGESPLVVVGMHNAAPEMSVAAARAILGKLDDVARLITASGHYAQMYNTAASISDGRRTLQSG